MRWKASEYNCEKGNFGRANCYTVSGLNIVIIGRIANLNDLSEIEITMNYHWMQILEIIYKTDY